MPGVIDQLIINPPYEEPREHWRYDRESRTFHRTEGRRPAGYVKATPGSKSFDDPGVFVPLALPNQIRERVAEWRAAGCPGITGVTERLLGHWRERSDWEDRRFFFCQIEAIETLVWLTEAPASSRQGLVVPGDGGAFPRFCAKMATGSGKTIVMAMLVAWQVLIKVASPQDRRFSKNVFVVAPGRKRLAVLEPSAPGNYYEAFDMVPSGLREKLRQGRVLVRKRHALNWETDDQLARRRTVDKRGAKSDAAFAREVLGELAAAAPSAEVEDRGAVRARPPGDLLAERASG